MSSSARMVIKASLRSTEHFDPLKSKRVPISRTTPWTALSTSARSVLETMSKLGIAISPDGASARHGARNPCVPKCQRQRTHHIEHIKCRPDSMIAKEWRQDEAGGKPKEGRDDHPVADFPPARGAEIDTVELKAPDRDERHGGNPQEMVACGLENVDVMGKVRQELRSPLVQYRPNRQSKDEAPEAARPYYAAQAVPVARADRLAGQALGRLGEPIQALRDDSDESEQNMIGRKDRIAHLRADAHQVSEERHQREGAQEDVAIDRHQAQQLFG